MRMIDFAMNAYAEKSLMDVRADVYSEARDLNIGQSVHLHPCFVYASSERSGESAHLLRDSPER